MVGVLRVVGILNKTENLIIPHFTLLIAIIVISLSFLVYTFGDKASVLILY